MDKIQGGTMAKFRFKPLRKLKAGVRSSAQVKAVRGFTVGNAKWVNWQTQVNRNTWVMGFHRHN